MGDIFPFARRGVDIIDVEGDSVFVEVDGMSIGVI